MSVQYLCDICGEPAFSSKVVLPMISTMGDWGLVEDTEINLCSACRCKIAKYIEATSESTGEEVSK